MALLLQNNKIHHLSWEIQIHGQKLDKYCQKFGTWHIIWKKFKLKEYTSLGKVWNKLKSQNAAQNILVQMFGVWIHQCYSIHRMYERKPENLSDNHLCKQQEIE